MKIHVDTTVSGYIQAGIHDIHKDVEISFHGVPALRLGQIVHSGGIFDSAVGEAAAMLYVQ